MLSMFYAGVSFLGTWTRSCGVLQQIALFTLLVVAHLSTNRVSHSEPRNTQMSTVSRSFGESYFPKRKAKIEKKKNRYLWCQSIGQQCEMYVQTDSGSGTSQHCRKSVHFHLLRCILIQIRVSECPLSHLFNLMRIVFSLKVRVFFLNW